ncbi:HAMP domain-containing sensor histidine kinase [Paenisporosarcina sp. TG20]|uniref:HAMP domain-containing sensor histidine kinase n=1 Tax=Paenisporosarcina sp. TG20 TaxID=1211706 RepID=UPI000313F604|nr:HAMP domain-containing sensor histidine kinase [Paenisporosarcina sp. TG20]
MNKISIKLASYFIVTVLIMESLLMLYLHQTIVHSRIDEEFSQLVLKGSNHRDVLEDNFSDDTMRHIVLMENDSDRQVAITDEEFNLILGTDGNKLDLDTTLTSLSSRKFREDQIIQSNWKDEEFIASLHPYKVNEEHAGYIIMFKSTETLQFLVNKLNFHFKLAGIASLVSLCIVYLILSRFLTSPLIRMKEATEKLSRGDFNVKLPPQGKDELGELSNAIQKLGSDLERVKRDRTEFLASVSHELRTPLTYLSGYSKVAMRSELNDSERQKYLSIIDEESKRMTELVKNLFDLAKMDENSFTVSKQSFESQPFFSHIYNRMYPSFVLKGIQLELKCTENFIVNADPLRLEQIVMNLLDNALKYSPRGTTTILDIVHKNGKTVFFVIDQGIGMRESDFENIFEKLFRVEKSRSREYGGVGLGLSIVKELVEAHGGNISVESDLGKGSKFIVII